MGGTTSQEKAVFSVGLAGKFCAKAGAAGVTPEQLNDLAQSEEGMRSFRRFLVNGYQLQMVVVPGSFPVWRAVQTGGKAKEQLTRELQAVNNQVGDWGQQMMAHRAFVTSPKAKQVAFAKVRVSDLGFTDPNNLPTTAQIWQRGQALGLGLCLPDDGPNLRLAYQDQPVGETIWVAMEQIPDARGFLGVFELARRAGGIWLGGACARPGCRWPLGLVLVFRKLT